MKKLKQAKAEAKTDLEKLTTEHELKYKDIEVFRFLKIFRSSTTPIRRVSNIGKSSPIYQNHYRLSKSALEYLTRHVRL